MKNKINKMSLVENKKLHLDFEIKTKFEAGLYPFLETKYPQVLEAIKTEKQITKDNEEVLKKALAEYKAIFVAK